MKADYNNGYESRFLESRESNIKYWLKQYEEACKRQDSGRMRIALDRLYELGQPMPKN
jgi:hypothetical protein